MRWSPFPADVTHPWRDVVVLASYGVREHARSPWFWLQVLLLPVLGVGVPLAYAWWTLDLTEPDLRLPVIAPDPAIAAALLAVPDQDRTTVLQTLPAEHEGRSQVWVEGDQLDAVRLRMENPHRFLAERHAAEAEELVALARRQAYTTEAERAAWDPPLPIEVEPATFDPTAPNKTERSDGEAIAANAPSEAPLLDFDLSPELASFVLDGIVYAGVWVGWFAAMATSESLRERREQGFLSVLRVGTSAAVLFLGGALEYLALGAMRLLPWLLLIALGSVALAVAVGTTSWVMLALTVAAGCASACLVAALTFCMLVGCASLLAAASLEHPVARTLSSLFMPLLPFVLGAALLWPPGFGDGVNRALSLLPGAGMLWWPWLVQTSTPGSLSCLAVSLTMQVLAAVAALRVGAWAYSLDESLSGAVSRQAWWPGGAR
jgi:hypothetical protein